MLENETKTKRFNGFYLSRPNPRNPATDSARGCYSSEPSDGSLTMTFLEIAVDSENVRAQPRTGLIKNRSGTSVK